MTFLTLLVAKCHHLHAVVMGCMEVEFQHMFLCMNPVNINVRPTFQRLANFEKMVGCHTYMLIVKQDRQSHFGVNRLPQIFKNYSYLCYVINSQGRHLAANEWNPIM